MSAILVERTERRAVDEKVLESLRQRLETLEKVLVWVDENHPCGPMCNQGMGHAHGQANALRLVICDFEILLEWLAGSPAQLTAHAELGYLELIEPPEPQEAKVICASGWLGKTGKLVLRTQADMYGLMFEGQAEPVFFSKAELEFL